MKKSVIITGLFMVVAFFILARFLAYPGQTTTTTQNPPGVTLPSSNQIPVLNTPPLLIKGLSATSSITIATNDFLHDSRTFADPNNPGFYLLGATSTSISASETFAITYIAPTQFFIVELLQEPIGQTRMEVEQYLEQYLGVTANTLCHLNYTVSVPWTVSTLYAGENLGFSFCPGATVLPQ